jgi:lipopolysaccharide/colanic/teichoic acid biosynthesis glycosyltransferase
MRQAAEWNDRQRRRLEAKPGLTGLAQISGRAELTIEDKLEIDVQYVEHAGLGMDIWILWRTLMMVLTGRQGIYEKRYSRSTEIETAATDRNRKSSG